MARHRRISIREMAAKAGRNPEEAARIADEACEANLIAPAFALE